MRNLTRADRDVGLTLQLLAEELLDEAGGGRLAAAGVGGQRVGELGGRLEALGGLEGQRLLEDAGRRIGQLADARPVVAR